VIVRRLRRDGIAPVYPPLGRGQAQAIREHLRSTPTYPGHVRVYGDGVPRSWEESAERFDVWCHDMATVVAAPYLWDLVISLLPTAGRYLAAPPRLYSLNAFWSRASAEAPRRDLQTWHRDHDDERFLAMFLYGTDVLTAADGPHLFKRGTHEGTEDGEVESVYGPAGTAFLADTRGLHMGMQPTSPEPRLLIWARWCVSERPWSYDQDRLSPVPADRLGDRYPKDPKVQDLVRLVTA
jgi:hypothetical protein